jgi:hypothetical protein
MSENIQSISQGTFTIGQTSATNFVAGPGIKIDEPSAGTVRIGNDETVLYSGAFTANNTKVILSEPISGFETFKIVWQLGGSEPGNRFIDEYESNTKQINVQHTNSIGTQYYYYFLAFWANNTSSFDYNYTYLMNIPKSGSPTILSNQYNEIQPIKVIGINRISGSNA